MKPKVLFTLYDMKRNGVSNFLLNALPHLDTEATVCSIKGGPMEDDFRKAGARVVGEFDFRAEDFDLVFVNSMLTSQYVDIAQKAKVPCVLYVHEMRQQSPELLALSAKCSCVLFASVSASKLTTAWENPRVKIVQAVIPAVKDKPDRQSSRKALGIGDEFVLLNVGRLDLNKNQKDLVQIAKKLSVTVICVGEIMDDTWLRDPPPNFRHFQPDNDILKYYAAADLYVCCSLSECFPQSTQEAKQFNIPVITTPVGGIPEQIFDYYHGLHYYPGDIDTLEWKIRALMADKEKYKAMCRPITHLRSHSDMCRELAEIIRDASGVRLPEQKAEETLITQKLKKLPNHADIWGSRYWLDDENYFPVYARVLEALNPSRIVEIGTLMGYTLSTAVLVCDRLQEVVWVDIESAVPESNRLARQNIEAAAEIADRKKLELRCYNNQKDIDEKIQPGPWADTVVHIDGDHSFTAVMLDLEWTFSRRPEVILLHDFGCPGSPDVEPAIRAFCRRYDLDLYEVNCSYGMAIIPVTADAQEIFVALQKQGVQMMRAE